jgi:hypothetical protein
VLSQHCPWVHRRVHQVVLLVGTNDLMNTRLYYEARADEFAADGRLPNVTDAITAVAPGVAKRVQVTPESAGLGDTGVSGSR